LQFLKRFWLAIVLFIIVCVFIGQNRERTRIDLFWLHLTSPLWLVLALTTAIGLVIGLLAGRRRERTKNARSAGSHASGASAAEGPGHAR